MKLSLAEKDVAIARNYKHGRHIERVVRQVDVAEGHRQGALPVHAPSWRHAASYLIVLSRHAKVPVRVFAV